MDFLTKVVILLLLQSGVLFAFKSKVTELEYSYEAEVSANSFVDPNVISYFGLAGKLKMQLNDNIVFKFADLKTTAFNGRESDIENNAKLLEISDKASPIYKPFSVCGNSSIGHETDEPIWSLNMKRAIVSIFQFEESVLTGGTENTTEWSIYGGCDVNYKVEKFQDSAIIKKTLDTCEEEPDISWGNSIAYFGSHTFHGYKMLTKNVVRKYTVSETGETELRLSRVESTSNVTLKTMPQKRRTQHIIQKQIFTLVASSETDKPFDFRNSVCKNLTYEHHDLPTNEQDIAKLLADLRIYFDHYQENLNSEDIGQFNFKDDFVIDKIFNIFKEISKVKSDFSNLLKPFLVNPKFVQLFSSLLPYIGTEGSLKYIKKIIVNNQRSTSATARILATFPKFLHSVNEEVLEELEILMNFEKADCEIIKTNSILSFASMVAECYETNKCSKETLMKYANQYRKYYTDAKTYDLRMIYMLGLSSMAVGLDVDFILPLITNVHEYPQLRSLATYAFQYAVRCESEQVYTTMWPIVNNQSESHDVRVAALDLILGLVLPVEEFYSIMKTFEEYSSDHRNQHLYNYYYTAMVNFPKELKKPQSYRSFLTGMYGMALGDIDDDFGLKFITRLVANPKTNYLDTVQFKIKRHAMKLHLENYSIYLKIEGVLDSWLEDLLRERTNADIAVPDLLKIIQKNNFKLKEFANVHIDGVLFENDKAVVALHLEREALLDLITNFLQFIANVDGVTYPVWHTTSIPSDLGTLITYTNKVTQFLDLKSDSENTCSSWEDSDFVFKLRYDRISYIELACNNPINKLSIASSDTKSIKYQMVFPFVANKSEHYFKWLNDNITLNAVVDVMPATFATEEQLKEYCASCLEFYRFPQVDVITGDLPLTTFGIRLQWNGTYAGFEKRNSTKIKDAAVLKLYENILPKPQNYSSFVDELPPVHILFDVWSHFFYMPNVDTLSISIRNTPVYPVPTESTIQYNFMKDTFEVHKSLVSGSASIAFTNRKINDRALLRHWNITSHLQTAEKGTKQNNFTIHVDNIYENGKEQKMCFDSNILFPVPRREVYSLSSSKSMDFNLYTFSSGINSCDPEDFSEKATVHFSVTDEQKKFVHTLPEFDICEKQSIGLKFTPPTKECIKISHILSNYRRYDMKWRAKVNISSSSAGFEMTGNTSLIFHINNKNFTFELNGEKKHYNTLKYFTELFLCDSIDRWFYEEDVKWGHQSNCLITPSNVKTFTDEDITNYGYKVDVKSVAFVECVNTTRTGLAFTRLDDQHLTFKLWSEGSVLTATRTNNKMRARLNGKIIKAGAIEQTNALKVFIFDNDSLYAYDSLITVYYNTEYIMIKTYSNYNNYICGLCSSQN